MTPQETGSPKWVARSVSGNMYQNLRKNAPPIVKNFEPQMMSNGTKRKSALIRDPTGAPSDLVGPGEVVHDLRKAWSKVAAPKQRTKPWRGRATMHVG